MKRHIVKRKGKLEAYDEKKVYASVYAAALNCHYSEKESEKIASHILKKVSSWTRKHLLIDSRDLRDRILLHLKKKDKHVALMYKHHLDVC